MINPTEIHIVPTIENPMRLQEYGIGIFSLCPTRSALKKALKKQYVTVNGAVAGTATYINGGETIELSIPKKEAPGKKLILPLKVIFEDEHLAVIRKPAGILVSGNRFMTIANALDQNLKPSALPDATPPQPVHRLDYPTTGTLLVGKTSSSIRILNRMFQEKQVTKTYFAVTIGKMENSGQITLDIDGKKSLSYYALHRSVPSKRFGQLNLLQLDPRSGRRHQLRRHLAGIGNPILGDKQYGIEGMILKGKGLYLHAYSLKFKHPFTGEELHITANIPEKFEKILGH